MTAHLPRALLKPRPEAPSTWESDLVTQPVSRCFVSAWISLVARIQTSSHLVQFWYLGKY